MATQSYELTRVASASEALAAITAKGILASALPPPGQIIRIPTKAKPASKNGMVRVDNDGLGLVAKDMAMHGDGEGWHFRWEARRQGGGDHHRPAPSPAAITGGEGGDHPPSPESLASEVMAIETARRIWNQATPQNPQSRTCHPYLSRKGIMAGQARVIDAGHAKGLGAWTQGMAAGNWLVLRITNTEGEGRGLEFIDNNGEKRPLKGTSRQGRGIPCGEWPERGLPPPHVILCEGWATGQWLAEHGGLPVWASGGGGNLAILAGVTAAAWPDTAITICGDDDFAIEINHGQNLRAAITAVTGGEWPSTITGEQARAAITRLGDHGMASEKNAGLKHAIKAAAAINASLALPAWHSVTNRGERMTDWLDYGQAKGNDTAAGELNEALGM